MKRDLALVVLALGLVAGCGGKVVFVEDDGSGASGVGGAGPGPGPGPGPGQTSTSTSTGIETVCQQWCNTFGACLGEPDCIGTCESFFTGQCDAELSNILVCLTNNFNGNCGGDLGCDAEQQAYESCLNPGSCTTDFCDNGPDGGCYCQGTCFGEQLLEQQCFFPVPGDGNGGQPGDPPPPPSTCDCYLDGSYFGSCDNFEFECSIEQGCCENLVGGIG